MAQAMTPGQQQAIAAAEARLQAKLAKSPADSPAQSSLTTGQQQAIAAAEARLQARSQTQPPAIGDAYASMARAAEAQGQESPQAIKRTAQLAGQALAPYATAAGAGFALGGPYGAAAMPLALAGTDLAANVYNAFAPQFNGSPIATGSERIQNMAQSLGIARPPETFGENLAVTGLEAATGGGAAAKGFNALATRAGQAPGAIKNVLTTLGERPEVQTAAAAGAATAPVAAQEAAKDSPVLRSVTENPVGATLISLLGGLVGGRAATLGGTPKVPSTQQIRQQATASYTAAKNAGVVFTPAATQRLTTDIGQALDDAGFSPLTDSRALAELDKLKNNPSPLSFEELDRFSSKTAKKYGASADPDTRRFAKEFKDAISDFVSSATHTDITQGNLSAAQTALNNAKQLWASSAKSKQVEELIRRAEYHPDGAMAGLRQEFSSLMKNPKTERRFTEDELALLDKVAKGTFIARKLKDIGENVPTSGLTLATLAGLTTRDPYLTGAAALTGAFTAKGADAAANALAAAKARQAAAFMRGARPAPYPRTQILSPTVQNALATYNQNAMSQPQ